MSEEILASNLIKVVFSNSKESAYDSFLTNAPEIEIQTCQKHYKFLWDIIENLEELHLDPVDLKPAIKARFEKLKETGFWDLAKLHTRINVASVIAYLTHKGYKIIYPTEVEVHVR